MTASQIVILAAALTVALLALLGSVLASRALARSGAGLRALDEQLTARAIVLPRQFAELSERLTNLDVQAEHALWMLGNLDDRMDRATVEMRAKRVASDTLRLRLIEGRLTIARLRQLVRLLIKLGELRRVVL